MESVIGLPRDILELIVDVLISFMKPLPLEALATEDYCVTQVDGYGVERHTLRNMSLVHRTWTEVVRRGLWHRAIFRARDMNTSGVFAYAPNCALIRELALIGSGSDEEPYWANFTTMLHQSPNLRKLYIDMEVQGPTEAGFLQLMQQLRLCSQLESLWLAGDMEDCYKEILLAISCLPRLKSLVLDTVVSTEEDIEALRELEPPMNLQSVALFDCLDWQYASWLIRPREGHFILDLAFSIEYPDQLEEEPDSIEHFHQCLRHLRTLYISTSSTDGESEQAIHGDCLTELLKRTRGLTGFALTASMLRTSSLRLPNTVKFFHIHHDVQLGSFLSRDSDMLKENDRNIATIITESRPIASSDPSGSHLRQVVISFTYDGSGITDRIISRFRNEVFVETQLACSLAGVVLIFETYASPYFGILPEIGPFAS
ncbi:hypothetical protein ACEPAF_526 [Sanghuangporus sanghuang]